MGKRVKIKGGFIGVWLGDGTLGYDEGDEVVLSDRQYERLTAGVKSQVLEVLAEVPDPQSEANLATQAELDAALLNYASKVDPAGVDFAGPLTVGGKPVGGGGDGSTPADDYLRPGYFYMFAPAGVGLQSVALASNVLYLRPIRLPVTKTLSGLGVNLAVTAAGATLTMGVYSNSVGVPGQVLAQGTVVTDAGSAAVVPMNTVLTKGVYWLALFSPNAPTVTAFSGSEFSEPMVGTTTAPVSAINQSQYLQATHTTSTLTDNPVVIAGANATPLVSVRFSA